ncbi:MAG TPA: MlaD family protein [Caulobacteraceae bacterium]|jgi:phospholipid/cholesterol/gamma-HCH transport system substrate-binding protein
MERDANYALVGALSLAILVGLVAFIVWLAGFSFNRKYDVYDIAFIGPVRGLSQGGEVHFNGIRVGEISDISLDPKDPNRVLARARLRAGVPVRTDSYAQLEPQGITGVNFVQITAGTPARPLLMSTVKDGQIPVIRSQKSALSDLLEGGGTVLQRTVQALDQINKVLSDRNIQTLGSTLDNVQDVTAELRRRKALLDHADETIRSIERTADSITRLANSSNTLVNTDAKRTLANLADTAAELKTTAQSARATITRLEEPTLEFATTGLPQLTEAVTSLRQTSESLNALVGEARQSPKSLVMKPSPKEIEVEP